MRGMMRMTSMMVVKGHLIQNDYNDYNDVSSNELVELTRTCSCCFEHMHLPCYVSDMASAIYFACVLGFVKHP